MTRVRSRPLAERARTWLLSRRPHRPTVLTLALAGALSIIGTVILTQAPQAALVQAGPVPQGPLFLLVLGSVFLVTELGQALVEVRRQAYSFSLSGIPLVLGLLFCPPTELLLVRLAATTLAFTLQRAAPLKFAYNTAAYLLDTALVVTLLHYLAGSRDEVSLGVAAACYLSLGSVDLLMSLLVLLVIRINQGPVSRAEAVEALLPAGAFVAINTVAGFIAAQLLGGGALGLALLVAFVGITGAGYRGYVVLRRRHQSLELVQGFIEHGQGADSVEELLGRLLTEVRHLLRAGRVELALLGPDGLLSLSAESVEQGFSLHRPERPTALEPLLAATLATAESRLVRPGADEPAHRRWLANRDAHEALVVPLDRSEASGVLLALDRLGDATHFTRDDLSFMQALAGHLAVAIRSRDLVQRLRHEATHDPLTGLPNRSLLNQRVQDALDNADPARSSAVLLLDLNRFKEVNDALGHHVGDQLLQEVAARLSEVVAEPATVARLGGDEFAVLIPPSADAQGDAEATAMAVARALSIPVDLPDVTVTTEASIGIALAHPGQDHADLLRHADTAMYEAKATGSGFAVYTPELDRGRAERLALVADLHLALERDELVLHYQPKLDLEQFRITSLEALVRWDHPTLGRLTPDRFVPLAESTGLIEPLTRVVLAKALAQCRAWQDSGIDVSVAVNLSARNISNTALPEQVADALRTAGLAPDRLVLEITESSVMGDPELTVPTLDRLAGLGVALSLDDFGTGYSSLSYLQRIPVEEVKIDRSFVLGLERPADARASEVLIRSIVGLGTSLGLRIVAEGIESAEMMERLRGLGCHLVQGYFIGRPALPEHLVELLAASAPRRTAGLPQH